MLLKAAVVGLLLSSVGAPSQSSGEEVRSPVPAQAERRTPLKEKNFRKTELTMDRYHNSVEITRAKKAGMTHATFLTEPQLLDPGAVIIFEVY